MGWDFFLGKCKYYKTRFGGMRTTKWVDVIVCTCCFDETANNDFKSPLPDTSGGTSVNISQAPLCYEGGTQKSERHRSSNQRS